MKKIIFSVIILLSLLTLSCSRDMIILNEETDTDLTYIRIRNSSNYDFKNVILYPVSNFSENYGDISRGETTEYKSFDTAYQELKTILKVNGTEFRYEPVSQNTFLSKAKFTLDIKIGSFQNQSLILTLQQD